MSALYRAIDDRLHLRPVLEALQQSLPPNYSSPLRAPPYSLGRLSLYLLIILVLSGLGLLLFYVPTPELAARSLATLHRDRPLGWLIHNAHRWSAFLWILSVILHALRAWIERAFAPPRDINWWLGLGLLLVAIGMGGTGYLLRWDIKAFALMELLVSNFAKLPVIGTLLLGAMLGGSELDQIPLYRGYAFHVWILPLLLVLILIIHLVFSWRQGLASPSGFWESIHHRLPFRRLHTLIPGLGLLVVVIVLSLATPHEGQAGPTDRSLWPHPDWILMLYFIPFWFFQRSWRALGAGILPLALLGFLVLAPWIARKARSRWQSATLALFGLVGVVWLWGQIAGMGYRVPTQGCSACHRAGILGGAPTALSEFNIRDPNWLVFHLKEPEISILTPSEPADRLP